MEEKGKKVRIDLKQLDLDLDLDLDLERKWDYLKEKIIMN